MRKVLVLSPHYDDAVLSAGQFMAGRPDAEVVTIFNWCSNDADVQTTYDAKCGFKTADEAVHGRQSENNEALALLGATSVEVNMPDAQYGAARMEDGFIANRIMPLLGGSYEFILAPLGLAHPDHDQTTRIALRLQKELELPIYLWEDLPIRVLEPQLIPARIKELGIKVELKSPGTGPIADKIRALLCYKSQMGTGILNPYIMYVPERFWKVK